MQESIHLKSFNLSHGPKMVQICNSGGDEAQLTAFCGVSGLTFMHCARWNSGSVLNFRAAASAPTKFGMRWCTGRGNLYGGKHSGVHQCME